jgi:hypothetical protein
MDVTRLTEDEQVALAIQMSMSQQAESSSTLQSDTEMNEEPQSVKVSRLDNY